MARTTVALALALAGAIMLAGCDRFNTSAAPITTDTVEGKIRGNRNGGEEVRAWRDPDTGCQYLLWERRGRGSMTPRLTAEGRPMCRTN